MTKMMMMLSIAMLLNGCAAAVLETATTQAIRLDGKTIEWVEKNRDSVCERAKTDPFLLASINEGIAKRVLHPEICAMP